MKKRLTLILFFLISIVIVSCNDANDTEEYYIVSQIENPSLKAVYYPGVTVIHWSEVKDAERYKLYRSVNGIEELIQNSSDRQFFDYTTNISNTTYTYRVVAIPKDSTFHNSGESKASITTPQDSKFAPSGTSYENLFKYETSSSISNLNADSITYRTVDSSKGSIIVMFPVKPYANYTVELYDMDNKNCISRAYINDVITPKMASCSLTSDSIGSKQILITANPLSSLYLESVYKKDFSDDELETPSGLSVKNDKESCEFVLTWNQAKGASYYRIYENSSDDFYTASYVESCNDTKFIQTYKENYQKYLWVSAVNTEKGIESKQSDSIHCNFDFKLRNPSYVKAYNSVSNKYIYISWESTNAYEYEIYYSSKKDIKNARYLDSTSKNSYYWEYPDNGTFYFWIMSISSNGEESEYSPVSDDVSCNIVYQTPNITTAYLQDSTIFVNWESVPCYKYEFYFSSENDISTARCLDTATNSYFIEKEKDVYYFWVKSCSFTGKTKSEVYDSFVY